MALPELPTQGQTPWFDERNDWDLAVEADIEGRLSDTAISTKIVETSGALDSTTTGSALRDAQSGGARTVALTGHSLMYGMDTTAGGTNPPVNGAGLTRSALPTTTQFQTMSSTYLSPGTVTIVNQSYPGDRSTEALTRWAGGVSGDLEIIWIDANDGLSSGAGPALSDADTAKNIRDLILRARSRGADVIFVGGTPGQDDSDSRKIFAAADTDRVVVERMGARYVDAGEILTGLPKATAMFSSGVHFTAAGYNLVGTRLAALTGPKGSNPPKVAPGRVFTPRDRVHNLRSGGVVVARAGAADGSVWQLPSAGSTIALSVDVEQPCIPLIRARISGTTDGFGTFGVYSNLGGSGISNRFGKITPSASIAASSGGFVYFLGAPMLSPGPDSVIVRREAGSIEIDSIQFIPLEQMQRFAGNALFEQRRTRAIKLAPVGGVSTGRPNSSWDAMFDVTSGVALASGSAQTTKVNTRWLFDLSLGPNNSGVALSQSIFGNPDSSPWISAQGYLFIRSGTSLIARKLDDAGAVDTTFTSAFASATGIVRCSLEILYDEVNDKFTIYLDGTLIGDVLTPAWSYYMAGIIAGTAVGGGYASGSGSVVQKASTTV